MKTNSSMSLSFPVELSLHYPWVTNQVTLQQIQVDFSRTDLVFTDYDKLYYKGAFCQQSYFHRSVLANCKNKTLLIWLQTIPKEN